ncbi:hypothetical protein P171DRAFT_438196 [Karstenula rhodostoma CBS 690.94]|uniref:Uncharacterized protein n=1 Tax=Karstenula rhodostoma CBS 690.94 TaxID=1392251 RepID=A0A9P4PWC0_9PLEO|nr:hypothetical protein P171DRAFT_438196 [Karstenula rhodostoma CBS 690.94]
MKDERRKIQGEKQKNKYACLDRSQPPSLGSLEHMQPSQPATHSLHEHLQNLRFNPCVLQSVIPCNVAPKMSCCEEKSGLQPEDWDIGRQHEDPRKIDSRKGIWSDVLSMPQNSVVRLPYPGEGIGIGIGTRYSPINHQGILIPPAVLCPWILCVTPSSICIWNGWIAGRRSCRYLISWAHVIPYDQFARNSFVVWFCWSTTTKPVCCVTELIRAGLPEFSIHNNKEDASLEKSDIDTQLC